MRKGSYLIFGLFVFSLLTSIFYSPQRVLASATDVIINEVMANPLGNDTGQEWLEIANFGIEVINLQNWQLKIYGSDATTLKKTIVLGDVSLNPGNFLVIVSDTTFSKPCDSCLVYDGQFGSTQITNSKGKISLISSLGSWQSNFTWDEDVGDGHSMEIIGPPSDPDFLSWQKSLSTGGTPGLANDKFVVLPDYPQEVLDLVNLDDALIYQVQVTSIVDGDTIKVEGLPILSPTIRLLAVDTPEVGQPFYDLSKEFTEGLLGQSVDLLISKKATEQYDNPIYYRTLAVVIFDNKVFNSQLLEEGLASYYETTNSLLKNEIWNRIGQEAQQERVGLWESAGEIILSELLPDPQGNDAEGEWIEIYNPTLEPVVLSRYLLDQYLIPAQTIVSPKSFLVFHRNQTEITLNNNGDTIKIFFPGGLLLDETSYDQAPEGESWALINGGWNWTISTTPGSENVWEIGDAGGDDGEIDDNVPINSEPVSIKTGEFRNFENYLVIVQGEVIETSGDTFYLDDGSGRAKVYIQETTGIDKPPMHKGDIFEVIGIVNLYRNTWRILPQKQDDIKIIEAVKTATSKSSIIKKARAASTSSKSQSKSPNTARSPTTLAKNVASVTDFQNKNTDSTFWEQFLKVVVGIALILLIVLIFRIRNIKREEIIGGNFGDET